LRDEPGSPTNPVLVRWGGTNPYGLTHEILEALASKQADLNQDGKISVDELEAFVALKVAVMTGGLQRPTVDRDNINQRFSFPLLH
jgi:hypothetical protein